MKGRPIDWTQDELAFIEARATMPRKQAHAEFQARFQRPEIGLAAFCALCKRRGWMTGRDGRIKPGHIPANKGRKGYSPPGSEKGWFRPGARQGRAVALHKPIGYERLNKNGYRERKINDDLPFNARWRGVHLIEWEAVNGPIPDGHALKCLDGDRANTTPSNWVAIPRALLPRLNGRFGRNYDNAPPALRPTLMAIAKLEHAAREARKAREETAP